MTVQIGFLNLYMIITMAIFPGDRIGHAYRICKFHHVPRYICIKDCQFVCYVWDLYQYFTNQATKGKMTVQIGFENLTTSTTNSSSITEFNTSLSGNLSSVLDALINNSYICYILWSNLNYSIKKQSIYYLKNTQTLKHLFKLYLPF